MTNADNPSGNMNYTMPGPNVDYTSVPGNAMRDSTACKNCGGDIAPTDPILMSDATGSTFCSLACLEAQEPVPADKGKT